MHHFHTGLLLTVSVKLQTKCHNILARPTTEQTTEVIVTTKLRMAVTTEPVEVTTEETTELTTTEITKAVSSG